MLAVRPPTPAADAFRQTQWWNWIGGPLGALIVLAGAALTTYLGAAAFIAAVVGGQLVCSLVLDHFALMGLPEQSITPGRAVGAVLVVAGVLCIKYL
jgi:transporter family-2 protein